MDAMTSFVDFMWGEMPAPYTGPVPIATTQHNTQQGMVQTPSFVFLGASADVGIFKNCFGDANSFYRTSSFVALGGYSEDRHLGYEVRPHIPLTNTPHNCSMSWRWQHVNVWGGARGCRCSSLRQSTDDEMRGRGMGGACRTGSCTRAS